MQELDNALRRYFNGGGSVADLIHEHGDPRQALLLHRVYWPAFETVEGYVVLAESVADPATRKRLEHAIAADDLGVLDGFRWIEVPYLFSARALDEPDDRLLAELMCRTWEAALASAHPERSWRTRVLEPEETGSVVGVAFEEVRS